MVLFTESQPFWALIIAATIMLPIVLYKVYKHSGVIDNAALRYTVLGVIGGVSAFIIALVGTLRLKTTVYEDGIAYGFCSFNIDNREKVSFRHIDSFRLVKRSNLDWGLKHDNVHTVSYTTSGKDAIQLCLADKKILIGTHQKDALLSAIWKAARAAK